MYPQRRKSAGQHPHWARTNLGSDKGYYRYVRGASEPPTISYGLSEVAAWTVEARWSSASAIPTKDHLSPLRDCGGAPSSGAVPQQVLESVSVEDYAGLESILSPQQMCDDTAFVDRSLPPKVTPQVASQVTHIAQPEDELMEEHDVRYYHEEDSGACTTSGGTRTPDGCAQSCVPYIEAHDSSRHSRCGCAGVILSQADPRLDDASQEPNTKSSNDAGNTPVHQYPRRS